MNAHTPGPWFNGQDGFNLGNGVVYARHSNGNPKDVATIRGWGGEQQQNSRLISAAPDLLEFAEEWLSSQGDDANYMTAKARAVIARAKGVQP